MSGCITVYNMYMSRYRCAQRVFTYPAPPNRINIAVENFDTGFVLLDCICLLFPSFKHIRKFVKIRSFLQSLVQVWSAGIQEIESCQHLSEKLKFFLICSVAGNLGGQIVVLLPMVLSGAVYMNAHQVILLPLILQ